MTDLRPKPKAELTEGLVALFESFMLSEDYEEAINFISFERSVPTPFVINELIFKIMMDCDENLAYAASDYLESKWRIMSVFEDQKNNFMKALKEQSDTQCDLWDIFSHFVQSNLHHLQILELSHSDKEYVKSPNCYLLVDIYTKVFLKCSIKSEILGFRAEERISCLLKWISLYYKFNFLEQTVLQNLHELLDHIVESEISSDPSVPPYVKLHTVNLSHYMSLILSICKDVFATPEKQVTFFIFSTSPYLITKVCQYRLHELIEDKALPQYPEVLTLKSIVDNYFFRPPEKVGTKGLKGSPKTRKKPNRVKKLKKSSKGPIPGDTDFHVHCRLGRFGDLLNSLYTNKNQDVNEKNSAGNTPLHEACLASSYVCAKFLIEEAGERKVDYKATDVKGRTPLHCAVSVGASDIVKLLLGRGGNYLIKCQDDWGLKPIDYSTSKEMKSLLLEAESKLEETLKLEESDVHKSQESSDSTLQKLVKLKNPKDLHHYLRTLKTLTSNYCDIYDLPRYETDVKTLSHDSKKCYHYKAVSETLCTEDASVLRTFRDIIKKFVSCAEHVSKEEIDKKELFSWNTYAAVFK